MGFHIMTIVATDMILNTAYTDENNIKITAQERRIKAYWLEPCRYKSKRR